MYVTLSILYLFIINLSHNLLQPVSFVFSANESGLFLSFIPVGLRREITLIAEDKTSLLVPQSKLAS